MKSLIILTLFCLTISLTNGDCVNKGPTPLKIYTINLDSDPKDRFKQTATDYKEGIIDLVNFQK
jgi:hypothetical protein